MDLEQQTVIYATNMEQKTGNSWGYFKAFLEFIKELNKVSVPSTVGQVVIYVFLLFVSWYMVILASRIMHRMVKPFLVVTAATFLFSYVRTMEAAHLKDLFKQAARLVNDGLANAIETFFRFWDR